MISPNYSADAAVMSKGERNASANQVISKNRVPFSGYNSHKFSRIIVFSVSLALFDKPQLRAN